MEDDNGAGGLNSSSRDRLPAIQRLGPSDQVNLAGVNNFAEDPPSNSRDRLPAAQRLREQSSTNNQTRIPATLRLGIDPVRSPPIQQDVPVSAKRKLGRPLGKSRVPASPSMGKEANTKNKESTGTEGYKMSQEDQQ